MRLALPASFRPADILAFQARDPQQLAERVDADGFAKGLIWHGAPACLRVAFQHGQVEVELDVDGTPASAGAIAGLARHVLGLDQPVDTFETAHRHHPQLGPLLARHAGLRVPQAATPFEALSWAVTGQQISTAAAISIRRRLIACIGVRHSGGLACYPDAAHLAVQDEERLRGAGLSQSKARALLSLARLVADGALPLEAWLTGTPADDIRSRLLAVRGIGPWTVDYALLRGFAHLDGSLHGDAAVRRGLQKLLNREDKVGESEARAWLADFTPWRALAAAHLWAVAKET
ncbi:MAG: DNA-3-methyladenine glycosylase 2 family protein [Proteobacteria bacterium]|nr:DNA-3-methyladenine glycosylase 2 family protein [Pseudomonadota bacterium]